MIVPTLLAFALLGSLLWIEGRRFDGLRRGLRAAGWALVVASLWLLVVRPTWTREVEVVEAVLVTPGSTAELVQAARRDAGRDAPVFAIDTGTAAAQGTRAVPDLGFVMRQHPGVRRLRVTGHGLASWEWDRTTAKVVPAGAAPLALGVSHIRWPREIVLGETWIVRGRLAGAAAAPAVLNLIGPGGVVATTDVTPDPNRTFELRATPPRPGRHLYRLTLTAADGTPLGEETLDVVVRGPDRLAVLWLEGAPGFETRHFKHWFTQGGDALVVRSTLSRDRTRVERLNHASVNVDRLSEGLLGGFDLLVLDGRSLVALAHEERVALTRAVEGGLGVLLRDDEAEGLAAAVPEFLARWPMRPIADLERFGARPRLGDGTIAAVLEVAPREIVAAGGVLPLLADESGVILAASRLVGSGTVGFSLLADSFRWVLEGSPADHANYWSHVIGSLARQRRDPRWRPADGAILVDDPLTLTLETSEPQPKCSVLDGGEAPFQLAPRQDPLDPRRWETTFRPRREGWHTVEADGGTTAFYVQPRAAWRTWQDAQRQSATARRGVEAPPAGGPAAATTPVEAGAPTLLVYFIFLSSLAALWIDERR